MGQEHSTNSFIKFYQEQTTGYCGCSMGHDEGTRARVGKDRDLRRRQGLEGGGQGRTSVDGFAVQSPWTDRPGARSTRHCAALRHVRAHHKTLATIYLKVSLPSPAVRMHTCAHAHNAPDLQMISEDWCEDRCLV